MISCIELKCEFCNQTFTKELRYHKRNLKLKQKPFCSRSCLGKYNNEKFNTTLHLKYGKDLDVFSPYRKHFNSARSRSMKKCIDFEIELDDLHRLWCNQDGKCALSGIDLLLSKKTSDSLKNPFMASLDRIDSSKGYTKDNIQWVCWIGQLAKHTFNTDDINKFCAEYCRNNKI